MSKTHTSPPDRETVVVTAGNADEAIAQISLVLAAQPDYFRLGSSIVRIDDRDKLHTLTADTALIEVSRYVDLQKLIFRKGEWEQVSVDLSAPLAKALVACAPSSAFRELVGFADGVILRADGSVRTKAGYDAITKLWLRNPIKVKLMPIDKAVKVLRSLVAEFPFADHDADFAVWLAMILTPLARHLIDGCVPALAFSATTKGAGKGKLIETAITISSGDCEPGRVGKEGTTEARKKITTYMLDGRRHFLTDDIKRPFGNDVIDEFLTATTYTDRKLGGSTSVARKNLVTWYVTGNSLQLASDTGRRCLIGVINPECEHAEDRVFDADPVTVAKKLRPRFLSAAISILIAHAKDNRPQYVQPLGSFEAWTNAVADAIVHACGKRADIRTVFDRQREDADQDRQAKRHLFACLKIMFGSRKFSSSEVIKRFDSKSDLKEAVAMLLDDRSRVDDVRAIGFLLGHLVGGQHDGIEMIKAGRDRFGTRYQMRSVDS